MNAPVKNVRQFHRWPCWLDGNARQHLSSKSAKVHKIEKLQLEHVDRLKPAIALYMIIAWRVLYLTVLGRRCPNLSCDAVFDTKEWQAVYIVTKKAHPPKQPPRLNEMVKMIASYGGYLNRKGDGEPGPKSLWVGLQRVRDFMLGINAQKGLQE